MSRALASPVMGQPLGQLALPAELTRKAATMASAFWQSQFDEEFTEQVATEPATADLSTAWLPLQALQEMGYAPSPEACDSYWVMTTGTEPHADDDVRATLMLVLHNDAMFFQQGRKRFVHEPGQWYLFVDNRMHQVDRTPRSSENAVYLAWAVKLELIT